MTGWSLAVLGLAVVVAVVTPLLAGRAGPGRGGVAGARSRARSAHAELGHHVEALPPGGGPGSGTGDELLARARERWTSAGAALAAARSAGELAVAERTAAEGLALVARVCTQRGLPGPAVPEPAAGGPRRRG
ncbi:hypothetical protein GCM10027047_09780 [Rhodococcus aerolatus]